MASLDLSSGQWRLFEGQGDGELEERLSVHESGRVAESGQLMSWPADARLIIRETGVSLRMFRGSSCNRRFGITDWQALNLEAHETVAAGRWSASRLISIRHRSATLNIWHSPFFMRRSRAMRIDARSRKNLEVYNSLAGDPKAGLIHVIDQTVTPMGARLLREWIDHPLADVQAITARQDGVESLIGDSEVLTGLRECSETDSRHGADADTDCTAQVRPPGLPRSGRESAGTARAPGAVG